jgi:cyclopropane fatty-acyl-phospholipid synthase-like methyltransferase
MLRRLTFDLWYLFRPPWDRGISPPELFDFIADHAAGRALDLGCGTGTNVITLVQHGWQVTGVDFAARAVRKARRKLRQAGLQADVRLGDVTRLEGISGPFDLALDMGCYHGIPEHGAYLAQLKRVLAPGGYWLLYAVLRPHGEPAPMGLMPSDLETITSSGLELVSRTDGYNRGTRPSAWLTYQYVGP